MSNSHYTDNELHLMSYPDLRRLSTLLQLPANIKKKYMISMIKAHQKGDCCMKTAIANKIMEERKVKRLNNKKKQSKSFMVGSSDNSQQIPTDLSVSAQHEFETHFSYVAHYSKDEISSGISRIIKQEAEVSRRNRSILQQRKPTRKLSAVGRTEIMLPRNHSLTTPVRLMPQCERGFPPPGDYEAISGLTNAKNHFQDLNYNYQFHGEFSNALMPTTSHELYRSEPYWHTREVYNNPLMPILSSLLTPSSVTINSSSYASQYTSSNSLKGATSFQGVYENYIKSNSIIESQAFQSSVANSSTLIVNNHHVINSNTNNTYNVNRGSYLCTKEDVDYEVTSAPNEINCEHCIKRDNIIRNPNESQGFLDFYSSRHTEPAPQAVQITAVRDIPEYSNVCFPTSETKELSPISPIPHRSFESSSMIAYKTSEMVSDSVETDASDHENVPPVVDRVYESGYTEEEKLWKESDNGTKKFFRKDPMEKVNFESGFVTSQSQGSLLSDVSDASTSYTTGTELHEKESNNNENESLTFPPNFPRCRYTLGHNKYPEAVTDSNKIMKLPSFLSTFCSNELYSKAYSVCKNSFTGTTETHLNPIMTCTCAAQFSSHSNSQQAQVNNSTGGAQIQRQWCYTYPESQVPFPMDSAATYPIWNEYSHDMEGNVAQNNHNVQIIKCRTHGCHYLYSVSNRCE